MVKKVWAAIGQASTLLGIFILTVAVWHITLKEFGIQLKYWVSITLFFIDIFVVLILTDRLIYFFSQFVLPVQTQKDRHKIYTRVWNFNFGEAGPAIFIKNGRAIYQKDELKRKGPGVVILDTASAAVLRTDVEFKETIGPGVKFTETYKVNDETFNEYLAESIDLRTQWQFIGPMASDDPYIHPLTSPKQFLETDARQQKTNGWTRDGFELSATLSIKFRIKRKINMVPENGVKSEYKFDPTYVRKAIIYEPVKLEKQVETKELLKWDKLPEKLVVNLWREHLRQFRLEDVFFNQNGVSALQKIEDDINRRVRNPRLLPPIHADNPSEEYTENLEYKQLEERGIEVINVAIHNVTFTDQKIEKEILSQWSNEWFKFEKKREELLKKEKIAIEILASQKAKQKFSCIASNKFSNTKNKFNKYQTLQLLLEPLKDYLHVESHKNKEIESTFIHLNSVWNWFLSVKK